MNVARELALENTIDRLKMQLDEKQKIDKHMLHDDLIEAFIGYQHRLDCPMPTALDTPETIRMKYLSNPIFRARVDSLAAGVMQIIDKHIQG